MKRLTLEQAKRQILTQKIAALKGEIAQAQQEMAKLDAAEDAGKNLGVVDDVIMRSEWEASLTSLEATAAAEAASRPPSPYASRNRYGRIESGSRG